MRRLNIACSMVHLAHPHTEPAVNLLCLPQYATFAVSTRETGRRQVGNLQLTLVRQVASSLPEVGSKLPKENHPKENHPKENHPKENYPKENYPKENHPKENHPKENHPKENYPKENYHRLSDYPIIRLPDCPIIRLSDCPIMRLSDYHIIRLSDYPIIRLLDCPIIRLSDYLTCRPLVDYQMAQPVER